MQGQALNDSPINLAAPRKQNIACDACRTRKVKCVMIPSQEKCQHCQAKSYPCTFNVQRETSEKKRQGVTRRRNSESTTGAIQNTANFSSSVSSSTSPVPVPPPPTYGAPDSPAASLASFYPNAYHTLTSRAQAPHALTQPSLESPSVPPASGPPFMPSPLPPSQPPLQSSYPETPTTRLLAYLFSPEGPSPFFPESSRGYRALPDYRQRQQLRLDDWGEVGIKLQDPAFRIEFALDLVEVYFEICHTRIALLGPARFRAQLRASLPPTSASLSTPGTSTSSLSHPQSQLHTHPQGSPQSSYSQPAVHPAILATVLAWGAKFSEHPLIMMDRNADVSGARRSRLASSLIKKAREVAEAERVHIVPSADAVIVSLLLDGLHSHHVSDPDGYRGFWLNCGMRHLLHLQINNRSAISGLVEPDRRETMVYAWWMACLADSFAAAYFRRKPTLEDNDYNIDFYPQDITRIAQSEAEGPGSEKEHSVVKRPEFLAWYAASHAMARCAREMSRQLWRPIIQTEGIPFDVLCSIMRQLNGWRGEHLDKVGVPGVQVNWDFLAAVAACGHDATFHVMWVILYQALREFGLRETNEAKRTGNNITSHLAAQFAATEAQVHEEALNAASRIAGLTNLLTQSSYLRLDPNVMHFCIYAAGKMLAEFGREEVTMCIRGLQQYGISYEDALDQAEEIQRMYETVSRVNPDPAQVWEDVNGVDNHHTSYAMSDGASYGRNPNTQAVSTMRRRV